MKNYDNGWNEDYPGKKMRLDSRTLFFALSYPSFLVEDPASCSCLSNDSS
ncbi:hypothetical protein DYY67_1420 [Candidatus Nitrosotalea sp. TS]|nr:hypothetical protein [Candidatus Nitrosotalea sp. TS]